MVVARDMVWKVGYEENVRRVDGCMAVNIL